MVWEEVINELHSPWLAGFGRTETPSRMFGLGRETETWEEPFFKQHKREGKSKLKDQKMEKEFRQMGQKMAKKV